MMYKDFHGLFKGQQPSVSLFRRIISKLPVQQQNEWYRYAYQTALLEFHTLPEYYQIFFIRLIHHDWQRFANYITHETILGRLKCKLKDKDSTLKLFKILLLVSNNVNSSNNNFSFSLLLAFDFDLEMRTLVNKIHNLKLYPEDFWDMIESIKIDCESVDYPVKQV